jgi:hypothetical protein
MIDASHYREYAADCVRQAQDETSPSDRTILLNVALAWVRLAQQTQDFNGASAATKAEPSEAAMA